MKGMGKLLVSVLLAGSLAACGGGGDGDSASSSLSVSATGSANQGVSVGVGQSSTLSVQSNDFVTLKTSKPVKWQAVITNAQTTVTNQTLTDTQWSGNLVSDRGDNIVLTAALASDASKVFTLRITVLPKRYNALPYKTGEVSTFAETQVRMDGSRTVKNLAYTIGATNNGQTTVTSADAVTNAVDTSYVQDQDRNRLSRTYTNGNVCTYSPKRNFYDMPLYVGKTWTGSWNYACQAGYQEKGDLVGTVQGFETLNTPLGTLNTLSLAMTITYTQSNDPALPGGTSGKATYSESAIAWWSPDLGRIVKFQSNYSYPTGFNNAAWMTLYTQELTSLR